MRIFLVIIALFFILTVGVNSDFILKEALAKEETGTMVSPAIDSYMTFEEAMRKECPPEIKKKQAIVDVSYYSFDAQIHKGQVVIDKRLVEDIKRVFGIALKEKFPIMSVIPISNDRFLKDGKWNDDDLSMLSDNTSAFNYRMITGGKKTLSNHAYGFAIDINPVQNPYIKNGIILPPGAIYDERKPGTLTSESVIVKTFLSLGWTWGGNWKTLKDYQHFEKILN